MSCRCQAGMSMSKNARATTPFSGWSRVAARRTASSRSVCAQTRKTAVSDDRGWWWEPSRCLRAAAGSMDAKRTYSTRTISCLCSDGGRSIVWSRRSSTCARPELATSSYSALLRSKSSASAATSAKLGGVGATVGFWLSAVPGASAREPVGLAGRWRARRAQWHARTSRSRRRGCIRQPRARRLSPAQRPSNTGACDSTDGGAISRR